MSLEYRKQAQFELFPKILAPVEQSSGWGMAWKDLTVSLENIIVFTIISMMVLVFAFALGMERGKKMADRLANPGIGQTPAVITTAVNPQMRDSENIQPKLPATAAEEPVVQEKKAPAPKPLLKNGYTVQVASFKSDKYAYQEAKILEKKGLETFVVSKGKYVILCVGRFEGKEEAKKLIVKLKTKYKDCLIRSL